MIDQEVNPSRGERVEPMASNPEAAMSRDRRSSVGPKVEVAYQEVGVGLSPKARLVLRR